MTAQPSTPDPAVFEPYRPFPVAALPLPCRRFVSEAAHAIGCDASYVALPLLAALAGIIGNPRAIRLKRGWTEPAVVWIAIIGKSGQLKSPALDAVLRPLHATELVAVRHHAEAMERFERDLAIYDADLKVWKGRGRKAGEPPPEKPQPPICARIVISDCTVEAVAALLGENPRGLLLARDELAGWLKSFDQYKGGRGSDCQAWLTMHGARTYIGDRKTGPKKTTVVPRAAVSVCGGVQPEILQRVLGFEHFQDGLAARLLLASPPSRVKIWTDAELSDATQGELANLFTELQALVPDIDDSGDPRQLYELQGKLEALHVFYRDDVDGFCKVFFKPKAAQSPSDHAMMNSFLDPAVGRFRQLDEEGQEEFRGLLNTFRNLYGFLSQVIPFQDSDLEKLYSYARFLASKLPPRSTGEKYLFDDEVSLKFYRLQKISEGSIRLDEGDNVPVAGPTAVGTGKSKDTQIELSRLIDTINERFGTDFTQADELFFMQLREEAIADEGLRQAAKVNTVDNFRYVFLKALEGLFIDRMEQNEDLFAKYMNDADFKKVVSEYLLKQVYEDIRNDPAA